MERRLVMIEKPTNETASSNADVPRVGGEDDVRAASDPDFRVGGEDDVREHVDNLSRSASVAEKS
jgi:hypothetical protein